MLQYLLNDWWWFVIQMKAIIKEEFPIRFNQKCRGILKESYWQSRKLKPLKSFLIIENLSRILYSKLMPDQKQNFSEYFDCKHIFIQF